MWGYLPEGMASAAVLFEFKKTLLKDAWRSVEG
jgi:hypothetical protein